MCEAGRIVHHLANSISDPNTTVLCVGYMADQTLGRRIRNKEAGDWLKQLDTSRLKKIFMVHGEPAAQAAFKKYLAGIGFNDVEIVRYGQSWELL
jgi:metallo-beta-lactamase family protein